MGKKFRAWLKNPHGPWLAVFLVVQAILIAASVLCLIFMPLPYALQIFSYFIFALTACGIGYILYLIITAIKRGGVRIMNKHQTAHKFINNYEYRTLVFAVCSFVISILYAAFEGALAIISLSLWYATLAVYYALLAFMRGGVLLTRGYGVRHGFSEERLKRQDIRSYLASGIMLLVMTAALAGIVTLITVNGMQFEYAGIMIYVAAIYAFYKIIAGIIHLVKVRKHENLNIRTIRSINAADALVSIFALQTAMLQTFADSDTQFDPTAFNAVTGLVVVLLVVALGLSMIIRGTLFMRGKRLADAHVDCAGEKEGDER